MGRNEAGRTVARRNCSKQIGIVEREEKTKKNVERKMNWVDFVFLLANAFFLFVTLVFLLTFLEHRKRALYNPKPKRFPSLAVVIPAYNEEDTIAATIRAVRAMKYPRAFEVIVVNDGSKDNTLERAREEARHHENVRVVSQPNRGKAAALNKGISLARSELVATVDADSFPEPDALLKMVGYLNDARVAAVTASVKIHRPRSFIQFIQFVEYVSMNYLRKTSAFLQGITCTPGPLSVFRRKVLKKLGGFEVGNIVEDSEIALRLQKHRWRIENALDAIVHCETPYSLRGLVKQRVRWYHGALINAGKYSKLFFNKRFGNLGWFILPTNFIAVAFAIFVLFRFGVLFWQKINYLLFGVVSSSASAMAALNAASAGAGGLLATLWNYVVFVFDPEMLLTVDMLFVLAYIILVVVTLRFGFKAAGERFQWKWVHVYVIYLFVYSFLITATWIISLARLASGRKPVWGGIWS